MISLTANFINRFFVVAILEKASGSLHSFRSLRYIETAVRGAKQNFNASHSTTIWLEKALAFG
jgi:hypothetical protein